MALLLPVTSQQGALEYAEKIRASVADRVFALPGNQAIRITASFGVATYHSNGQGRVKLDDWLVARADEALYQAKNKGRNRVEAASDEPLNLCAAG
jgi:diguanylate cyclase (GGDEF)-like protein